MPVEHPKVAVLLAAYNGVRWIEEQLSSILNQSAIDVTVYISIDPSSDGTEVLCRTYAAEYPSVVVLPDSGRFGGASRNFFRLIRDVDFGNFDFIAFSDQDDIWHSNKLLRATQSIAEQRVDAYSSNVTAFWPDGKTILLDKAQPQVGLDYLFEAAGPGCTYVMNRALADSLKASMLANWQQLQGISLHDWYCYAYARSNGYRWYIDPATSMDYRQHERNQVGANTGLRPLISRYKTIHDGWWFSQVELIAALVKPEQAPSAVSRRLRGMQLIKLSFSAWQCRRRVRDKVFFFFICWASALLGSKS
ncbi:glycosyltransferase [Pseudomonas sp. PDM09]|uniref:glycosyltransferase n=1 Tax=Pseudomonas sp. PDM09 TaxID=2769270 RepID=UPI001786CA0A|nr:glycosyltransferase [Pseudomonas sp. PDM09]MBD9563416.1 glycosyltransferase [Pseudomonas sp. PDM09]